jgi:hypothetical protein
MEFIYKPDRIDPEFSTIRVMGCDVETIPVKLTPKDYQTCLEREKVFWANSKLGEYGQGLNKRAVLIGLLGEVGFAKVFDQSVDLTYRKGGDNQDFLIDGLKFDIKCAARNYGKNFVLHTNEGGYRITQDKHFYVGSFLEGFDKDNYGVQDVTVVLTGWMTLKQLLGCDVHEGVRGEKRGKRHLNYEMFFEDLRPTSDLLRLKNENRFVEIREALLGEK